MQITKSYFGELDGQKVEKYTMTNDHGFAVSCLNYGCIITEIYTPDRDGKLENVVLGFDNLEDYVEKSPNFGAVIGRVAGRIANASFELDGEAFPLAMNNNQNHIHGGIKGFAKVVWDASFLESENEVGLQFTYFCKDGEEGYPGNLPVKVTYSINNESELLISYEATTDRKTLINLTNHSYFNLSGNLKRDVLDHTLVLNSNKFVELKDDLIPTGTILEVENTPFDFRNGRKLKDGVESSHPQNKIANEGYDHPFLLNKEKDQEIVAWDEESGRTLIVETEELAVVLYTANQLSDNLVLQEGCQSKKHLGFCLETQGLPDSIHHNHFPSNILDANQTYATKTKFIFGIRN